MTALYDIESDDLLERMRSLKLGKLDEDYEDAAPRMLEYTNSQQAAMFG